MKLPVNNKRFIYFSQVKTSEEKKRNVRLAKMYNELLIVLDKRG